MNMMKHTVRAAGKAILALAALAATTLATVKEAQAQTNCRITSHNGEVIPALPEFGIPALTLWGPMQPVTMHMSASLTSGTNVSGRVHTYQTGTGGAGFRLSCTGNPGSQILTHVATASSAVIAGTEGPWTYYRVDDYFSIAFGWSDCSGTWYVPLAPFNSVCGSSWSIRPNGQYSTIPERRPTTWTVRLRVERAFSGPRVINFPNMFRYYYGDVPSDAATLQMISLAGSITVPETCTINAGQAIQVNFGDIGAGRFEAVGQKPAGYTPVTTSAPVTCNDAAAARNVKVSLAATPAPGLNSAIRTTNPDIGIVVQDVNDRTVRPNLDTLPLRLQSNGAGRNDGTVVMKAFPVSTTGRPPAEGNFSGTAAITVTFD